MGGMGDLELLRLFSFLSFSLVVSPPSLPSPLFALSPLSHATY